ncbi:hypothetical protein MSAN_00423400 [Mycena sanguinolenta]|uniref:Uncharacterized protein n=1 Tax=Mycena sanguinolenta TaxID=230812 RepID=A0A8H6ZDA4_9AGAR|nr:hypothetical protein MSAN_00423400 [Mycena sanguinolenta]
MERAQSLEIHFLGCEDVDSADQIATFKLLSKHSSRWELLTALAHCAGPGCSGETDESQRPGFDSVEFFHMAISLVDIGVFCEFRFLPTRLPALHQLTRYDFDAPWNKHRDLLKSLPNLQEVRIRRHFDDSDNWPEAGEPINMLHLRRLYVTDSAILACLRVPALEELTIGINHAEDRETCRALERLLACSSCAPRRLCIEGLLDVQSMAEMLQKHLCFTEIAITSTQDENEDIQREILSNFLALFTISNATPSAMMLPHITEIGFGCRKADAMLYPLFLKMLESRWTIQGSSLKAAELLFPDPLAHPDPRSIARAGKLRQAGLAILLLSGDEAEARVAEWLHHSSWWV